jgi:hypothetical protein
LYIVGSVLVCSQPKGVEQKMKRTLIKKWCKWSMGLEAKRRKTIGRNTSRHTAGTYIQDNEQDLRLFSPSIPFRRYNRRNNVENW